MIDGSQSKTEFDQFADRYSAIHADNIRLSGEEPAYFADYKIRQIRRILNRRAIKTVLDFGLGSEQVYRTSRAISRTRR